MRINGNIIIEPVQTQSTTIVWFKTLIRYWFAHSHTEWVTISIYFWFCLYNNWMRQYSYKPRYWDSMVSKICRCWSHAKYSNKKVWWSWSWGGGGGVVRKNGKTVSNNRKREILLSFQSPRRHLAGSATGIIDPIAAFGGKLQQRL